MKNKELTELLDKEINRAEVLLKSEDISENQIQQFVKEVSQSYGCKFEGLKGFYEGETWNIECGVSSWRGSLKVLLNKLKLEKAVLISEGINNLSDKSTKIKIENNNINNNSINSNISFEVKVNNAIEGIKELEGVLPDNTIKEALEKLKEIEKIQNEGENNNQKWKKAKDIFGWLTTQGVNIFSTVTPVILEMLK